MPENRFEIRRATPKAYKVINYQWINHPVHRPLRRSFCCSTTQCGSAGGCWADTGCCSVARDGLGPGQAGASAGCCVAGTKGNCKRKRRNNNTQRAAGSSRSSGRVGTAVSTFAAHGPVARPVMCHQSTRMQEQLRAIAKSAQIPTTPVQKMDPSIGARCEIKSEQTHCLHILFAGMFVIFSQAFTYVVIFCLWEARPSLSSIYPHGPLKRSACTLFSFSTTCDGTICFQWFPCKVVVRKWESGLS